MAGDARRPAERGRGAAPPGSPSGATPLLTTGRLGVRRDERPVAWLFFAYFFLIATAHYASKSVRQATYVDTLGADQLPWVYLLVALVSLPVIVLYTRLAERSRPERMIVGFCVLHSAVLAGFYWALGRPGAWAPFAFYVWVTVAFGVAVSQLWLYAQTAFDPRQARRLFALIAAGGLLGGIPGGLLARAVAGWVGTRATVLVAAAVMLLVVVVVALIERVRPESVVAPPVEAGSVRLREASIGLRTVLESRLLERIALLMLLTMVAAQMVDLQFNWVVEKSTAGLDQRTAVFGTFFSVMGVLAFLFQVVFTRRIHRRLGVGVGLRVLPLTVALASMVLMAVVLVGAAPLAILAAAWTLKLGETGLRHSIDQSSRELLFVPVPEGDRRLGKVFIDVFVQRFAKGAAAVLLLPVTFGLLDPRHVSVMTVVVVAAWLWVAAAARREYVQAFRDGLAPGSASAEPALDTGDLTTIKTLVEWMGSSDDRRVLHAVQLLSDHGEGRLVSPLLVHHHDPLVRRATIGVLAEAGRRDALPLVERAIGDADPDVRAAAVRASAALYGDSAADRMRARLADSDPRIRAAAVAFLLERGAGEGADAAADVLREMLSDGDPEVRAEAAKALGQVATAAGRAELVQLLYDADREVARAAVRAVQRRADAGDRSPLYLPILTAQMGDRRLKHDAREALVRLGEEAIAGLALFMHSSDEAVEVRREIPRTLARIGGPAAVRSLVDALSTEDAYLRRNVIGSMAALRRREGPLELPPGLVREEVHREAASYMGWLADLAAIGDPGRLRMAGPKVEWARRPAEPSLLERLIAERMAVTVRNLFSLLELRLAPDDVEAAARSVLTGGARMRARALEYLDNTLAGGALRRDVMAVLDDEPVADRLRRAREEFGVEVGRRSVVFRRLLEADLERRPDHRWLVMAALETLGADPSTELRPLVSELATASSDPLVRETAGWLAGWYGASGAVAAAMGQNGYMAPMAHVEMMRVLQGVDLFAHCTAEQVLRLAGIAREMRFEAGETIYRRSRPADTLYCVVDGRVRLTNGDGTVLEVGSRGRFGVLELISGKLRTADAVAAEDSRVLAISGDDFFDLLSANIEIVKAIFRRLASPGERDGAGLT